MSCQNLKNDTNSKYGIKKKNNLLGQRQLKTKAQLPPRRIKNHLCKTKIIHLLRHPEETAIHQIEMVLPTQAGNTNTNKE